MLRTALLIITLLAAMVVAETRASPVAAQEVEYTGPKFDLTRVQPEFRLGVFGTETHEQLLHRAQCLAVYAQAAYSVHARIFTFRDYASLVEAMLAGNLDYAWLAPSGYADIHLKNPSLIVPVAAPMTLAGETGYHSIMFARRDSGLATLEDLQGRRLGFADPNSVAGYRLPSIELVEKLGPLDQYFGTIRFVGSHEAAILAVLNREVDVAVTWVSGAGAWNEGYSGGVLRKLVDKGAVDMNDIVQVWRSRLVPSGPLVMSAKLPVEARDVLIGMKRWMLSNDPGCAERITGATLKDWIPVDHSSYEIVVEARKRAIDVDFKN